MPRLCSIGSEMESAEGNGSGGGLGGKACGSERLQEIARRGVRGDAGGADGHFVGVSAGQGIQGLSDAPDAGAAMHLLDLEGDGDHADWMPDWRVRRAG